jgi:hypothetical protein
LISVKWLSELPLEHRPIDGRSLGTLAPRRVGLSKDQPEWTDLDSILVGEEGGDEDLRTVQKGAVATPEIG